MPTVQNAVATKVKVSLGASLFIGVATAVTFSIGGAMLAGLAPGTGTGTTCYRQTGYPTLYQDANMTTVATGSCTTILTTTETPYMVKGITAATSIIGSPSAQYINFVQATSDAISYGELNDYYFNPSTGFETSEALAIRSVPRTGLSGYPANIVTINTNVGVLNICLPKVGQVETRFYVGKSGTLYSDALLTKRATTEACAVILNRAATPSSITAGSQLMNSGYITLSREAYNYSGLGSFSGYGFSSNTYGTILPGSKAPLRLTHSVWYGLNPTPTYPYTSPADILTLTTDVGTLNFCLPSRVFTSDRDGGYLFAGKDGTLYEDAHLTKRATTEACPTILARAAVPTTVTAGSRLMNSGYISLDREAYYSSGGLGSFSDYRFNVNSYGTIPAGSKAPLRLTQSIGLPHPEPIYPYITPADILTLTTDTGALNLCLPSHSFSFIFDGGYLFAGKDGSLYEDAHLTKRATTEACPTILARAATPRVITAGTRLTTGTYVSLDREAYYSSGGLGSFSDYGFNVNSYGTIPAGSKAPLRLTQRVGYSYPTPTYPFVAAEDVLTLTTDVGTLNVCLPSVTYTSDQDGGYLFAGKDGSTYNDALLQNVARKCSLNPTKEITIE